MVVWILLVFLLSFVLRKLVPDSKDFASLFVSSTAVAISMLTWWFNSVRVQHELQVAVSSDQQILSSVESKSPMGSPDYNIPVHVTFINRGNQSEVVQSSQVWLGKVDNDNFISGYSNGRTFSGPLVLKPGDIEVRNFVINADIIKDEKVLPPEARGPGVYLSASLDVILQTVTVDSSGNPFVVAHPLFAIRQMTNPPGSHIAGNVQIYPPYNRGAYSIIPR